MSAMPPLCYILVLPCVSMRTECSISCICVRPTVAQLEPPCRPGWRGYGRWLACTTRHQGWRGRTRRARWAATPEVAAMQHTRKQAFVTSPRTSQTIARLESIGFSNTIVCTPNKHSHTELRTVSCWVARTTHTATLKHAMRASSTTQACRLRSLIKESPYLRERGQGVAPAQTPVGHVVARQKLVIECTRSPLVRTVIEQTRPRC